MSRLAARLLPVPALLLLLPLAAAAQTPDLVMGTVPISADANETLFAAAGLVGGDDFTFEWQTGEQSATGRFLGLTPGAGEAPPHFALAWYDVPAGFPLHVAVSAPTGAQYSFSCAWGPADGEPVATIGSAAIWGDYDFGFHVPQAEAVALHLVLTDGKCDWDLTVTLDWGEGVAAGSTTLEAVKALYRD